MALAHNALAIAATQSIFLGLAWILVCCRLYIRKFMVHGLAIDDYFLVLTLILYTILAAMVSVLASVPIFNYPATLTEYTMHLDQVGRGVHYFFLAEVFYTITAASLRVTVGLLLLRIALDRAQRVTVYVTMLLMIATSLTFLALVIAQCTPTSFYWNFNPGATGSCYIERHVLSDAAYAYAGVSFLSDWILGLLPIWLLWNARISRGKKLGIGFMLSLGLLCGVAALTRIAYIGKLTPETFESHWIGIGLCSVIEPGLGIIAAAIAAFRPVFNTAWFKSLTSGSWSTKNRFSISGWSSTGGRSRTERSTTTPEMAVNTAAIGKSLNNGSRSGIGSGSGEVNGGYRINVTYEIDRWSTGPHSRMPE